MIRNNKLDLKVPVLMYHGVSDDFQDDQEVGNSPFYITIDQFRSQMSYLHEHGYQTMALARFGDMLRNDLSVIDADVSKMIIITFDDGYQNNYFHALKILKEFSFIATFFVVVNRIGTENYLTWEQLIQMANEGMEIQSHTYNHKPLELLSLEEVEQDLRLSKEILEQKLNKSVNFISYPHGSYNRKIIDIVKKVGFKGSCTSEVCFANSNSNPFTIGRLDIRKNYELKDFIKIVQRDRLFIQKLKLERSFKQVVQNSIGIENYNRLYKKVRKIHRAYD